MQRRRKKRSTRPARGGARRPASQPWVRTQFIRAPSDGRTAPVRHPNMGTLRLLVMWSCERASPIPLQLAITKGGIITTLHATCLIIIILISDSGRDGPLLLSHLRVFFSSSKGGGSPPTSNAPPKERCRPTDPRNHQSRQHRSVSSC
jgi:hypothetical protein